MSEQTSFVAGKHTIISRSPAIDEEIMDYGNRQNISWFVTAAHRVEGETMFEFENEEDQKRTMYHLVEKGIVIRPVPDVPHGHHYAESTTL